jgi:hypothetical protein
MTFNTNQVFSWIVSLISFPMGLIFGLLAGVFCFLVATHLKEDHFDDFTYWVNNDGLKSVKGVENDLAVNYKTNTIKGKRAYL